MFEVGSLNTTLIKMTIISYQNNNKSNNIKKNYTQSALWKFHVQNWTLYGNAYGKGRKIFGPALFGNT